MANALTKTWLRFYDSLNFFRVHVLFFTFTPLISATIFYAANGQYHIPFIDALFNCISAMTVTGLATVDLSQLTGFQQGIIFFLMCIGNPIIISWVIVFTRRRFFQNKLSHIIAEERKRERQGGGIIAAMRARTISISRSLSRDNNANPPSGANLPEIPEKISTRPGLLRRLANRVYPTAPPGKSPTSTVSGVATPSTDGAKRKGLAQRLRTDMIRRVETAPQRVDPMGRFGGMVVDEEGGKGKGREVNDGHHFAEKEAEYDHGGEVHHVATSSSGSRTRYDGGDSPDRTLSQMEVEAALNAMHHDSTPTPKQLDHDVAPAANPAPTPTGLQLAPFMESPGEISDDGSGIVRRIDGDVGTDEGTEAHPARQVCSDLDSAFFGVGGSPVLSRTGGLPSIETDDQSSPRTRISSSPVRFKPPPIRINPGTLGDDRLSPSRARDTDHASVSFGHERSTSEAVTLREPTTAASGTGEFPRTQTVEFIETPRVRGRAGTRRQSAGVNSERERERTRFRNFSMGGGGGSDAGDTSSANAGGASSAGHGPTYGRARAGSTGRPRMGSVSTAYFPRTATGRSYGTARVAPNAQIPTNQSGYGGFPMPHELAGRAIRRFFPRTLTLTRTLTVGSAHAEPREVPYISFDAIVGRNSQFHDLSQEEQDELGGVEYRALGALLWIVGGYHLLTQLLAFVVIAPYSSMGKWASVFTEPQQHRFVPPTWFAAFQCVSSYTNTGMSLIDQSMIPFQTAYPMIVIMFFLILAGNTAFPIFLRFFIWLLSKVVGQRMHETLSFLLDHPRRCFIYLFPSHQTWFLLIVLLSMVITDWVSFMVLDIGNEVIEAVPIGTRFAIGFLQAAAVRAAGFATVSLSALAPAVKVLYVTMMYVAVYPIAISVRSTNVYEEQSLGLYLNDDQKEEEEPNPSGGPMHAWGSYLAWHARRQLSFDMWWLAFALWLLCIIERGEIMNPESNGSFDVFTIIFELVSAYGTVGLSLGLPDANYSFSGALKPLSKLVICIVMLRGRHRGLPHAIDRAVVLPREYIGESHAQGHGPLGFDFAGTRPSGETGPSHDAHSTSRAPVHGVDLKHRTNTLLSPVHEVLTPVTSVTASPRPTFAALGTGN